jgi:hypothetical protein
MCEADRRDRERDGRRERARGGGYSRLSVGGLGLVLRIVYSVIFPTFRRERRRAGTILGIRGVLQRVARGGEGSEMMRMGGKDGKLRTTRMKAVENCGFLVVCSFSRGVSRLFRFTSVVGRRRVFDFWLHSHTCGF